jgi:hypothetical protein
LELHHRCDAIRADELLDHTIRSPGKNLNLLSTASKRHNRKGEGELVPCLSKDCAGKIVDFLPFCKGCYLQCMAGKTPVVELRDGLGKVTYNPKTMRIEFPSTVPASRIPQPRKGPAGAPGKSLVAHVALRFARSSVMDDTDSVLFYVDSGAGQCLCSCISAFVQMTPCRIEITGVSGLLEIFGCGTALFMITDSYDNQVILRVNNCLFS